MADRPRVILSGFADEAANHKTAVEQFAAFAALGLYYYSIRFIDVGRGVKHALQLTLAEIFITLADVMALAGLLVLVEIARQAFHGVRRRTWIGWTLMLAAVAAYVIIAWGPWPDRRILIVDSQLAVLRLMALVAQKGEMLVGLLSVGLGLLAVLFGRRFRAGWRSHAQMIAIGLSTAAMAQLTVQRAWQTILMKAAPHSEAEFERLMGLRDKLFNANSAIYVAVLVWWIVWLWMDEPGTAAAAEVHALSTTEETQQAPE